MPIKTTTTLKKIKIRELLNTSASKPWNQLSADLKTGANNPLVANSKAGPLIGTFSGIIDAINPFLKVSKIIETVKPKIGMVVKIVGAFRNPALIPDIVQDILVKVQSLVLKGIISTVTKAGDRILNTEIALKNISREQFEKLQDSIKQFQIDSETAVSEKLEDFEYEMNKTSDTINGIDGDLDTALDAITNSVSSGIDALDPVLSLEEVRMNILQLAADATSGDTSSLVVLVPTDEELFMYVDKELKAMVAEISKYAGEGVASLVIDTSAISAGLDSESLAVFNELKDGFKEMATSVISGNKETVFEAATYKENSEIVAIVNLLKKLVDIEVIKVKRRYYEDIKRFIETETDIQVIKDGTKTITIIKVEIYDILNNKIFRIEISKIKAANEESLYIFDEEYLGLFEDDRLSKYYAGFNRDAYEQALNIFNIYKVDVIRYLLAGEVVFISTGGFGIGIDRSELELLRTKEITTVVTKRGFRVTDNDMKNVNSFFSSRYNYKDIKTTLPTLEEEQFVFSVDLVDYIKSSILTIVNGLSGLFNKNDFISQLSVLIDGASTVISKNLTYSGENTFSYKISKFRNDLYRNYKEQTFKFYKTTPAILGRVDFITSNTMPKEKIMLYFNDIVKTYLESIVYTSIGVILNNSVGCSRFIEEDKVESKIYNKVYSGVTRFKDKIKETITTDINAMTFTNDIGETKATLLLYFEGEDFLSKISTLKFDFYGNGMISNTFLNVLREQESKVFNVMVKQMESL